MENLALLIVCTLATSPLVSAQSNTTTAPPAVNETSTTQEPQLNSTATMGTIETTAALSPESPIFALIIVALALLAGGVILVLTVMACLCCFESRRAKNRRGSDEMALLPRSTGPEEELDTAVREEPSHVTLAIKVDDGTPEDGIPQQSQSDKDLLIPLQTSSKQQQMSLQQQEIKSAASADAIVLSLADGIKIASSSVANDSIEQEWENIPVSDKSIDTLSTSGSVIAEKARALGRTPSYTELLCQSSPLTADQINDLVYNADHYTGIHPLLKQYKSIPTNAIKLLDLLPEEKTKNRYRNVLPNPQSRVMLSDLGRPGSTYINANYVRGYGGKERAYIVTQGPLFETMGDFWRMAWEQEVCVVVMITSIVERGTHKCAKYWPSSADQEPTMYGEGLSVKNNFEERTSSGVISYLTLFNEKGEEREIYHFWCTAWPDFGVPKETGSILDLRQAVSDYRAQGEQDKPLLVHCSAGLGRSGTFIAIDMGVEQYEAENKVDPLKYVCEMRQDRGGIIQTPEQYLFVHNALADHMSIN